MRRKLFNSAASRLQSTLSVGGEVQQKKEQYNELDAQLEGTIAKYKRTKQSRINWDRPDNAEYRERLVTSWKTKTDLYRVGDSFCRFCKRNGIDRLVLLRYMKRIDAGDPPKKRGRKTLLSEDVMTHICEGL